MNNSLFALLADNGIIAKPSALLAQALTQDKVDVVDALLLHSDVDPAADGNQAIYDAVRHHWNACAKRLLLDARVNPDDEAGNGSTPLRAACYWGNTEMVALLLSRDDVDPTKRHSRAFRRACLLAHFQIVHLMLQDGRSDPAAHDNEALRIAVCKSHIKLVERLLQNGRVDPNQASIKYKKYGDGACAVRVALAKPKPNLDILTMLFEDERVSAMDYEDDIRKVIDQCEEGDVVAFLAGLLPPVVPQPVMTKKQSDSLVYDLIHYSDTVGDGVTTTLPITLTVRVDDARPAPHVVTATTTVAQDAFYLALHVGERYTVLFDDQMPFGYFFVENAQGERGYALKSYFA